MADQLVEFRRIAPPRLGLIEGLDDRSEEYPEGAAPSLENIRVGYGTWRTRLGMSLWKTLGGSGSVRTLDNVYTTDAKRIRLAARGSAGAAQLYDYLEGTDTSFQTVSGGGSLGGSAEPYFQGVVMNDIWYFTDRTGALRKYTASTRTVTTVAQPAAPSAAATVKPRSYDVLEDWAEGGGAPYGYTQSDAAKYELQDGSGTVTPPTGGNVVRLKGHNTALGATIAKNVSAEAVPSHTIAFWILQDLAKQNMHQFQFGLTTATDFAQALAMPAAQQWMPCFVQIGNIGTINYKRFIISSSGNGTDMYIGQIVLPGRLQGAYRWVYTHYDPSTGRESPPSAISNSGQALDLSVVGTTWQPSSAAAFQKCVAMSFTSDAGVDATTTQIRVYRNGGEASLTVNDQGQDVWLRVGTIYDQSTTINFGGGYAAGVTSFVVTAATNISIGDWLVLTKGTVGSEQYVRVTNVVGTTITIAHGLQYALANGATVQLAFLDNVGNESVDVTQSIELERQDPPSAAKWIARTGEGRLVLANFGSKPTGIAFSNRSTPDRGTDYEVFPSNVDPLTRGSATQGWQFELRGDSTDESIMWMGVFQGSVTVLTRKHLYVINANSQLDWGPDAIQPLLRIGCISGDTVQDCNGVLYWVAPGPHIVRWSGRGSAPEIVSNLRANVRLSAAPTAYWNQWFARYHPATTGHRYCLFFVPSGQTTPTQRLDFNMDLAQEGAFEPCTFLNVSNTYLSWQAAAVRSGGSDVDELYQCDSTGGVYQMETGTTDNGVAISIRAASKRMPLGGVALAHSLYAWLDAVSDSITVTLLTEGSEYGNTSHAYVLALSGSGDKEVKQRLDRDLLGRWLSITLTGSVSNGPEVHDLNVWTVPWRSGRVSA